MLQKHNAENVKMYFLLYVWYLSDLICISPQSVASDMRFELFSQNDVKKNSKRQRVINSRYREDYIEPIIYRAIME